MENLAHTLFGLALAQAGLEDASPLATTTLVIASNLPDIDWVMSIGGGSLSYIKYHRGYTHSFIGLVVLAAALVFFLKFVDRRLRLRRDLFRRPIRPWRLFWLACLGGLGHLFLDFTNSYGIRPLIPFSKQWFHGDLIFVAD
ncbi:MAG TPA: metal-dependent hydrolase, partial [Blastocatellia bacterium]|nr:metal-dependent hydrolase [Blastocatellia bacterium]